MKTLFKQILLIYFLFLSHITYSQNALHFGNTLDYVELNSLSGDLANDNTFTVEFVMRPDNRIDSFSHAIFTINDTTGVGNENILIIAIAPDGTIDATTVTTGGTYQSLDGLVNVRDGECHHVTYVKDGSLQTLFIDGCLDRQNNTAAALTINNNHRVSLGQDWDPSWVTSQHYFGTLDNFRVWNHPRSVVQIRDNLFQDVVSGSAGLLVNYNFNQGNAGGSNPLITQVTDNSGSTNTHNGNLISFDRTGWASNFILENCACIDYSETSCQSMYQREFSIDNINSLRTISTVVDGNRVYAVHQNNDRIGSTFFNSMVLTIRDAITGEIQIAQEYTYGQATDYFFSKELHVINEGGANDGIYVLGNVSHHGSDLDNSRYNHKISGVLMRIDPSNLTTQMFSIENTGLSSTVADAEPDNVFYNAFSPLRENGNLVGWIVVGSVRLKVNNHYRMHPMLTRLNTNGSVHSQVHLKVNIPCPSCTMHTIPYGPFESNWAVDISDQMDHQDHQYAVLLESRDTFNSIVGYTQANPVVNFRTSYIFIDDDLNIFTANPGQMEWWSATGATPSQLNARKILYDINAGQQSVMITGQNMDRSSGFVHEFDVSSGMYTATANSKDYPVADGLVDIVHHNGFFYALAKDRLLQLDATLNIIGSTELFNSDIFSFTTDFNWYRNYIGGLVRPHPVSGMLINDIGSQILFKTTDNLELTCFAEHDDITPTPAALTNIISGYEKIAFTTNHTTNMPVNTPLGFSEQCCINEVDYDLVQFEIENENTLNLDQLDQPTIGFNWLVAPNPANDAIHVYVNSSRASTISFSLHNVLGQQLIYIPFKDLAKGKNQYRIDLSSIPEGVYHLNMSSNGVSESKSILIRR